MSLRPCNAKGVTPLTTATLTLDVPTAVVVAVAVVLGVAAVFFAALFGRRSGRRALSQRLTALGSRLGIDPPEDETNIETALAYLEQVTGAATEAVAESSADAIRLRRSLDTLPQGVVLCDENGTVVYQNKRANALMVSRHGDALAAQAVTELLEDAWDDGAAERTLDLYGPPRRTLSIRAVLIDDGRRALGVIAMIDDVSERRKLEEIRRDFVANVSHELKTPMGALGLLSETLIAEPDPDVARRLAGRIHTEAFRVSRIIDDLLDLSRIESEESPPREPVLINLVMAEAVERVRSTAEQRGIVISLKEPDPPVAIAGDRRQLVSALHALLENAVTYSYDNSTITVSGVTTTETYSPDVRDGSSGETFTSPRGGSASVAPAAPAAPAAPEVADPSMTPPAGVTVVTDQGETTDDRPPDSSGDAYDAPHLHTQSHDENHAQTLIPIDADDVIERSVVRVSVRDQGVGIPSRDLDRIFERFYRVDQGRSRDTGGTGLGLSIVRHVANNHHGRVDVESREGEGSTFTLVLPIDQARPS